ncbi:MAG TPA: hypothetical protein VLL49_08325 [Anaerolineales bacterium]|nr:hypothetical protein [Anaerolineales bacterium]
MSAERDLQLRLATREDEPDIRALVGSVAMPGAVSVRFERQPDYFLGTSIMGETCEVLLARHRPDGRLAGMGCRAERRAYVNGQESQLGYIGQIRVGAGFRGTWLVQRGARWFAEHSDPDLVHFGVIASENSRARALLTGDRLPGGVHVRRLCGITTCAIVLREPSGESGKGIDVRSGSVDTMGEIVEFLRIQGRQRQFFPAYTVADFLGGERMRGLALEDIMVARRNKEVVGVMAAWDQAAYKQDVVDGYGPTLRRFRPVYNLLGRLFGFAPLPAPGAPIDMAFAACVCVAHEDLQVMRALLAACARHARRRGKAFLMLGLSDNDPLLGAVAGRLRITYHSELFAAAWSPEPLARLDARMPHVEIATL